MITNPTQKAPLFVAAAIMLSLVSTTALTREKATDPLAPAAIQAALDSAYAQFKDLREGKNADYIPALAKVDSNIYGIAIVTPDGRVYTKGDISSEVSIQSISKVFTMAKVIEGAGPRSDREADWRRTPPACASTRSFPSSSHRKRWAVRRSTRW